MKKSNPEKISSSIESLNIGTSRKILKSFIFCLVLVLYASIALHQIKLPVADDLARHIKNGEMIVKGNFEVLYKNVYSYTEPDQPFTNHHWLGGVIFYLLYIAIGFNGLVIFKVAVLLSAFTLLFLAAMRKADFWLVALFSIPTILVLSSRGAVRPEIFSFLFIAVFLYLLIDLEENPQKKNIFWLVPLQVFWVNTHIFFGVGILMVAGFLLEKLILNRGTDVGKLLIKKLVFLLVLLISASLVNPHGIGLFSFDVNFLNDNSVSIQEERSLMAWLRTEPLSDDISVALFIPMVIILAVSFIPGFRKKPIFYFLASIGSAVLSFAIISRGSAFFALMFLPTITSNLDGLFSKIKNQLQKRNQKIERILGYCSVALLIAVLVVLTFLGNWGKMYKYKSPGIGLTPRSNSSAEFFKEQGLRGPIFNDTDIGSYLIFHLFPQEKVFSDNRFRDAYSASFFADTYSPALQSEDVWRKVLGQYNFQTIFFYHYNVMPGAREFLVTRINDPLWSLVYADTYAVIFIKDIPENQEIIHTFSITKENADDKLAYLLASNDVNDHLAAADLFNLVGRKDLAIANFERIAQRWPQRAGRILMVLGETETEKDDLQSSVRAVDYLERAVAAGQNTAEAYAFLGLAYYRTGRIEKAIEALEIAIKINPDRKDARDFLEQIRKAHGI